ncbi:MAG: cation:proton antiporter [Puniceicoccales bacterium]|jgi:CPA2 family monovalent cation:H+ antiporter-2|nr:cation:proton antiporter [Puniceicoccales bacterium]
MEEGSLIKDLAIVVVSAGTVGMLFHFLRLPLLLGYIVSGFIIGPHFLSTPFVTDAYTIKQLSELGVIFLMFYVGIEFDLEKLKRAAGSALLAVLSQTICMVLIGILIAPLFGWSGLNGMFLGALLAITSTMVTIPMLKGQNAMSKNFAQLTMGILILEDIVAILLLVILSGIAITGYLEWEAVGRVTFLVGVFVVMVFVGGKFFASRLIRIMQKVTVPELFVLVIIGFALGLGELANKFHFSVELGAFLAGSILSQSAISKQIEHIIEPFRDIFSSIFFATIGMMIDPAAIVSNLPQILIISVIVLLAKSAACWFGLFASGERSDIAFQSATYISQIGEFSFIIAAMGNSLGVTNPSLISIAVGVSLLTIIGSTIMTKHHEILYASISKRTPEFLKHVGVFYHNLLHIISLEIGKSALIKIIRRPALQIIWYFFLLTGLMFLSYYTSHFIESNDIKILGKYKPQAVIATWILAAFVTMPIFIGAIKNINLIITSITHEALLSLKTNMARGGRTVNFIKSIVLAISMLIFGAIFLSVASNYLPTGTALAVFVLLSGALCIFFWSKLIYANNRFEIMFMETFNSEVQNKDDELRDNTLQKIKAKYPWDVQIKNHKIKKGSQFVGIRIIDSKLREETGATIVAVTRGGYTCYAPNPYSTIFPEDQLLLLGEKHQIDVAIELLEKSQEITKEQVVKQKFAIETVCIGATNELVGQTIGDANLRGKFGVNIVGIQRRGEKIVTPSRSMVLEANDILILAGTYNEIPKVIEFFQTNTDHL